MFHGISTFAGYLTPNIFFVNNQFYFKQYSLAWVQFNCQIHFYLNYKKKKKKKEEKENILSSCLNFWWFFIINCFRIIVFIFIVISEFRIDIVKKGGKGVEEG